MKDSWLLIALAVGAWWLWQRSRPPATQPPQDGGAYVPGADGGWEAIADDPESTPGTVSADPAMADDDEEFVWEAL